MTDEVKPALDFDPKVKEFIDSLTPERVKYLEASIQFSRDRESAGRFLKFLGILFAFVTGAIVAWDKVAVYITPGRHP
ncbi:hypothetical protein NKJ26_03085 [Mesorhizobium sp. M0152]|uniref:hypothetical protein n=1 Tax=Mesorhizobium sp. M0152 TaxID=2956898 RepID=UPI003339BCE2